MLGLAWLGLRLRFVNKTERKRERTKEERIGRKKEKNTVEAVEIIEEQVIENSLDGRGPHRST